MYYLWLLQLSLSQPLLILLMIVVAINCLFIYCFGWISLWYSLYYVKAVICVILNLSTTIANAIHFGIHALTRMLILAFQDLINNIMNVFLTPILNAINQIAVFVGFAQPGTFLIGPPGSDASIIMTPIGHGEEYPIQPSHAFAYYLPTSVVGANAWGFIAVRPGIPVYEIQDGKIQYDIVYDQRGAKLRYPRINPEAKADSWWVEIKDRPPDQPYFYNFTLNTYDYTLLDWIGETAGEIVDNLSGYIMKLIEPTTTIVDTAVDIAVERVIEWIKSQFWWLP